MCTDDGNSPKYATAGEPDSARERDDQLNLEHPGGISKDGQNVDFRIDTYSIPNGDSCKELYYSVKPLPSCSTELSKCLVPDGNGSTGRTANKLIKPHWYLYLHYN